MDDGGDERNYDVFRDCMFSAIVNNSESQRSANALKKGAKRKGKGSTPSSVSTAPTSRLKDSNDAAELAEFAEYLSSEAFYTFPSGLRSLSHQTMARNTPSLELYSLPLSLTVIEDLVGLLPPSLTDSLIAYGLVIPPASDVQSFMSPILAAFIAAVTAPPLKWIDTRSAGCEICDRDWVPTTYHHLIPKQVHAKALKRGWHEEHQLNSVAWLCRACHSFVHKMAPNEELAREWYTVEKICEREDIQKWAQWVRRVRWKKS